jgi:hypothetical protein
MLNRVFFRLSTKELRKVGEAEKRSKHVYDAAKQRSRLVSEVQSGKAQPSGSRLTWMPEISKSLLDQATQGLSAYQQDMITPAHSWFLSQLRSRDFSTSSGSDVPYPNKDETTINDLATNISENLKDHRWLEDNLIERFQRTFKTEIEQNSWYKGRFIIKSEDKIRRGKFSNEIDVNEGVIRGLINYKYDTDDWYLSDVVYAQIQLALKEAKISQFVPTKWSSDNVVNEWTAPAAADFVRSIETAHTFQAGSKEFAAIAQTAIAKSRFYLLKDHFPSREIKSITIGYFCERLYIECEIGEKLPEGEKIGEQRDR